MVEIDNKQPTTNELKENWATDRKLTMKKKATDNKLSMMNEYPAGSFVSFAIG